MNDLHSLAERVAVLESRDVEQDRKLDAILSNQKLMMDSYQRFHGAFGIVAFMVTGVGVAWSIMGEWLKSHWK